MNVIFAGLRRRFQIKAFELCTSSSVAVCGHALNFTVNSAYPMWATPTTRSRDCSALTISSWRGAYHHHPLFRFNLVQRACGKYVQEQLNLSIVWPDRFWSWPP